MVFIIIALEKSVMRGRGVGVIMIISCGHLMTNNKNQFEFNSGGGWEGGSGEDGEYQIRISGGGGTREF